MESKDLSLCLPLLNMVLSGSKVKPDSSIQECSLAVKRANAYLKQTKKALERSEKTVTERLKAIERRDSEGNEKVSQEELLHIIRILVTNVQGNERAKREAEIAVANARDNFRRTVLQFLSGGVAGAVARTTVAPIDRVKILMQTGNLLSKSNQSQYTSISQSLRRIVENEGISRLWRGNLVNCFRVVPYAATQFASYDKYKHIFEEMNGGELTLPFRLLAGSMAGATATSITHPLDTVRLRLSVQPELNGFSGAVSSVWKEGGARTFYKGYGATILSLGPFIAINFATFDQFKHVVYTRYPSLESSTITTLGLGASAGLFAQTICFPLDTIRRRMQLPGKTYSSVSNAFATVARDEGIRGFYKGIGPNALKVLPNNAIRFMVYDHLKSYFQHQGHRK